WYAFGRFWIEGLRTDSLYLFDWTWFGQPIRVSQLLSLVLFIAAVAVLIVMRRKHPSPENLFVNRQARAAAAAREAADREEQERLEETEISGTDLDAMAGTFQQEVQAIQDEDREKRGE